MWSTDTGIRDTDLNTRTKSQDLREIAKACEIAKVQVQRSDEGQKCDLVVDFFELHRSVRYCAPNS